MPVTSPEYVKLRNILLVVAVFIVATVGLTYTANRSERQSDRRASVRSEYDRCESGNRFRQATREAIAGNVHYIDTLLAALTPRAPSIDKLTPEQQQVAANVIAARQAELGRASDPAYADRVCVKP